ncbi:MAG: hypothetical protein ACRDFS_01365, partial [Chloroflexota bacterium]
NSAQVSSRGFYSVALRHGLSAGTMITADIVDAAGNSDAAAAPVPGLELTAGGSVVRGWSGAPHPVLSLIRRGTVLVKQRLATALGGSFETSLLHNGHTLRLSTGDVIRIDSARHSRAIAVTRLTVRIANGSGVLARGPAGARIGLSYRCGRATGSSTLRLSRRGVGHLALPSIGGDLGDRVVAQYLLRSGDTLRAIARPNLIAARVGDTTIQGRAATGARIEIMARRNKQTFLAHVVATSATGRFRALLRNGAGRLLDVRPGTFLQVRGSGLTGSLRVAGGRKEQIARDIVVMPAAAVGKRR